MYIPKSRLKMIYYEIILRDHLAPSFLWYFSLWPLPRRCVCFFFNIIYERKWQHVKNPERSNLFFKEITRVQRNVILYLCVFGILSAWSTNLVITCCITMTKWHNWQTIKLIMPFDRDGQHVLVLTSLYDTILQILDLVNVTFMPFARMKWMQALFALCTVSPLAGRALMWQHYECKHYLTDWLWFNPFSSKPLTLQ